jgi:lipopolysaccharide transport system ATP-binding protein
MPKKLIVENLSKSYESNRWILQNISFSVESGKVTGIIGNKGAGKSTLLKILGRVIYPTSGRAIINGRVASLFEPGLTILRHLTGRENIFFNAAFYGIAITKILKKFDSIIALADLENSIDLPVKRYSIEMYLRLAWSIAVHLEPDVLLLDETIDLGDRDFKKRCLKYFKEASFRGTNILLVSNNLDLIQKYCHLCLWLHEGKIAEFALPNDVIEIYKNHLGDRESIDPNKKNNSNLAFAKNKSNSLENDSLKIISTNLFGDTQKTIEEAYRNNNLYISLIFETFVTSKKFKIAVDILNDKNYALKSSFDTNFIDGKPPGVYEIQVHFPSDILDTKVYLVNFLLSIEKINKEQATLIYEKAISLQVCDREEESFVSSSDDSLIQWKLLENKTVNSDETNNY